MSSVSRVTPAQPTYHRAEKLSDAAIHILGVIWGLIAAAAIIRYAAIWRHDPVIIIGAVIYAACLITMLTASAAYHLTPWDAWKDPLRRLDQSAIYVKIAGTYTPFALLAGSGALFLVGMWGAALVGMMLKIFAPDRYRTLGLLLYLGMGWFGVLLGGDLLSSLTTTGFSLMLIGGLIYTVGVIFFLWESLPFSTPIWHAHVLVATVLLYIAVLVEIADLPIL
ncbi:MAG: hemolysin III family protein [Pseudomonadota bacterium]